MTEAGRSISFDHAADVYDATRALPPDVARALTEALLWEIEAAGVPPDDTRRGGVLEVGVGTGRISRPLAERGVRVCGVDISRRMMGRLREQLTEKHVAPDLVMGDALALPFAGAAFRIVLSFHVLHLVADWRQAVRESVRVLAPQGTFVHYVKVDQHGRWEDSSRKWEEMLRARGFRRRHRPGLDEIADELRALGGRCRVVRAATEAESMTPAAMLEMTRSRTHSWTWEIPDELWEECFREYEEWVREEAGPMDEPRVETLLHELHVWTFTAPRTV